MLLVVRAGSIGTYVKRTFLLDDGVNRPLASIVSHGEIRVIADRNQWGLEKFNNLNQVLESLTTVDLNNPAIIEAYVELDRVSRSHPDGARALGDNDLWIAATAKAAGAVLLTTDKDFLHFHPDHCTVHYIDPKSRLVEET